MTINDFHEKISDMAKARMGLEAFCGFLQHTSQDDKYLREEYLAIQAIVVHKRYPSDAVIELGDQRQEWDARVGGADVFEVVQALPAKDHVIRKSVSAGEARVMAPVSDSEKGEPAEMPITGPIAQYLIQVDHAYDHVQFPRVIIDAIEKKHRKNYADKRTLVVVFDGDYSFEKDRIAYEWLEVIRRRTHRGVFKEIFLVERARQKVFPVF